MSEFTVNISDFHCRGMKARNSQNAARSLDRPYGLFVMEAAKTFAEPKSSSRAAGPCVVFDISTAREAQRASKRYTFRPIGASRKARVLRFTTAITKPAFKSTREVVAPIYATGNADGPMDLPPAA